MQMSLEPKSRPSPPFPDFRQCVPLPEIRFVPCPPTLISRQYCYESRLLSEKFDCASYLFFRSGCPNRFIGLFATIMSFSLREFIQSTASFESPVLPKIGVTIGPGATCYLGSAPRSSAGPVALATAAPLLLGGVRVHGRLLCLPLRSATLVFKMNRRAVIESAADAFLDSENTSLC